MTRIERAVDEFFDDHGDIYDGLHDLQVIWTYGNGVLVAAPWFGADVEPDACLTLSFESDNYAGFIEAFSIRGNVAEAIKSIKAEDVMNLYLKGNAFVDCGIGDDGKILWFQRTADGGMLVTDVYEAQHKLVYLLEEPEDFISYTRQYYKINKYVKEFVSLRSLKAKESCFVIN